MTDNALDTLATTACNPDTSKSELRRVALVAIGELSMLRREYALLKEHGFSGGRMDALNFAVVDPALALPIAEG